MWRHLSFIIVLGMLVCISSVLLAQTPEVDIEQVPDEYIEEAGAFYDRCSGDYQMVQYYNCECLSLAYLDERIDQGPSVHSSSITLAISRECRDAVGAAGPVYEDCLEQAYRFKAGTDPEAYCECVANTYVEYMNRVKPSIDSRRIVQFQTLAYGHCSNPNGEVPDILLR